AAYEVIPFDDAGRQAEIAKLEAWCERGGAKPSIQLITGAGGMGKSRLMIEVCRRIAHQGWHSGFVPSGFEGDRIAALLRGNAPRLLVVDYAETRLELLRPLLLRLSALKGPKVRLVLLSRSESDWWPSLASEERPISDLLLSSPPHMELRPLVSGLREDRLEAFRAA
ncbi:MAG: ATP-binding protein, partial [Acidobacteria bacterium]|nr:ATP-binding protein [Acidobacteriota bacterium]